MLSCSVDASNVFSLSDLDNLIFALALLSISWLKINVKDIASNFSVFIFKERGSTDSIEALWTSKFINSIINRNNSKIYLSKSNSFEKKIWCRNYTRWT